MALSQQDAAAYAVMQQIQSDPYLQAILRGPAANTVVGQRIARGAPAATAPAPIALVPVPGRRAREVVAVPPGSPAGSEATIGSSDAADPYGARVSGAADAAASYQPKLAPQLEELLNQRTAGGDPTLNTALQSLTGSTTGTADTGQPEDRGWLGNLLPAGVSNFIADAGTGLAVADPREPASMAFGKAFAGAQASNRARLDRKRADQRETKAEQRQAELDAIAEKERLYNHSQNDKNDSRYWSEREHQAQLESEAKARQAKLDEQAASSQKMVDAANGLQVELSVKARDRLQHQLDIGQLTDADIPQVLKIAADMTSKAAAIAEANGQPFDESGEMERNTDALSKRWIQLRDADPAKGSAGGTSAAAKGDSAAGTAASDAATVDSGAGTAAAAEPPKDPFADATVGTSADNPIIVPPGQDAVDYTNKLYQARGGKGHIYVQTEHGGVNVFP